MLQEKIRPSNLLRFAVFFSNVFIVGLFLFFHIVFLFVLLVGFKPASENNNNSNNKFVFLKNCHCIMLYIHFYSLTNDSKKKKKKRKETINDYNAKSTIGLSHVQMNTLNNPCNDRSV